MHHNTHASHSGTFLFDEDRSPFRLGFGALRITGPQGFGPPANEKNSLEVLKECLRLGVNFIDTADSYGPNISEELIARALYPYPKELLIATKGGYERPSPGEWQLNCWRDALENALKGSLKRLKVDRIDLYQLHRFDPAVPADEFLDKLKELQEQEYILHLGLSEVSIAQIEQAQQYFEVKSIQNKYSFTERKWEKELHWTNERGIAFIPWYPLDAGALDSSVLHSMVQKYECSVFQLAIAWLLQKSPNMIPIPGTSLIDHLRENVAAGSFQLDEEDMIALENE